MAGGTTFHFVTDGIGSAPEQARASAGDRDVAIAGDRDVAIAGGADTVQQFLAAGLIDDVHLHVAPIVLGAGEALFGGVGDPGLEPRFAGCDAHPPSGHGAALRAARRARGLSSGA